MGCSEPINFGSESDLSAATSSAEDGKTAEGLAWSFGVILGVCILGTVAYAYGRQKKRKDGKRIVATTHFDDADNFNADGKESEA